MKSVSELITLVEQCIADSNLGMQDHHTHSLIKAVRVDQIAKDQLITELVTALDQILTHAKYLHEHLSVTQMEKLRTLNVRRFTAAESALSKAKPK